MVCRGGSADRRRLPRDRRDRREARTPQLRGKARFEETNPRCPLESVEAGFRSQDAGVRSLHWRIGGSLVEHQDSRNEPTMSFRISESRIRDAGVRGLGRGDLRQNISTRGTNPTCALESTKAARPDRQSSTLRSETDIMSLDGPASGKMAIRLGPAGSRHVLDFRARFG